MTAWSVSSAVLANTKSVNAQEPSPTGIFFRPNGLKMYVIGDNTDRVYEYNLSVAWNISTATIFQSFLISAQTTNPTGLFFRSDGLKMYIASQSFPSLVYEYNLSSAWNISTLSFLQSISVNAQDQNSQDLFFKPDGLKMYIVGNFNNRINEYNLSTAWNISTTSFLQSKNVGTEDTTPSGIFIRDDGLKMYVSGAGNDRIYEYNLTTPWNITTAVFFQSFLTNVSNVLTDGIFFRSDGAKMYHVDGSLHNAYEYDLPFTPPTVRIKTTKMRARLVSVTESINDPTGWIKVGNNVATKILIDDPLYPDLIRLNLDGGGGINPRYAYKDTGKVISGNVKFEFKLDYDAMGLIGFPATISVGFCASTFHPQQQGVNSAIRVDLVYTTTNSIAMSGIVSDGTTTIVTTSGAKNQHSLWIYPNSNNPISDSSLKGPYYVTVELNNDQLRLSTYKDSAKTQHIRGSPIIVSATGIIPTNLKYIMVGNDVTGVIEKVFQGSLDDFVITQNELLPVIPPKPAPATGLFTENWEGYIAGDQNPTPWISRNEIFGGIVTPLIDIHEVSTSAPLQGLKAFKIDQRFDKISGSPIGRVSVSRFMPAIVRTDGSGLDIPLTLIGKMKTDIISSVINGNAVGLMVGYEFISGAPLPSPITQRGILFKLYGDGSATTYIWNGTEWISNHPIDVPVSLSNTVGTIAELSGFNLKGALDNSAILSNVHGLDFESHVTGMWVGYVGLNTSTSPTEILINADETSILNAGTSAIPFSINAILVYRKVEFFINATLIHLPLIFTIDALFQPVPATAKVNARLVVRHAVNSTYANAILVLSPATAIDKTFKVNAIIFPPSYKTFKIGANTPERNQKTYFINAIIPSYRSKTFRIDAHLTPPPEPKSTLDIESTIGFQKLV